MKLLLNRLSKCYDPSREVLPETRKPPPVKRTDQTAWRPDPKFSILTEKLFFLSLQFCFCWLAPVCLIFPNVPFEWAQTLKILKCQFFLEMSSCLFICFCRRCLSIVGVIYDGLGVVVEHVVCRVLFSVVGLVSFLLKFTHVVIH